MSRSVGSDSDVGYRGDGGDDSGEDGPEELGDFDPGNFMILDTHPGHPEATDTDDMTGLVADSFAEETTLVDALGGTSPGTHHSF